MSLTKDSWKEYLVPAPKYEWFGVPVEVPKENYAAVRVYINGNYLQDASYKVSRVIHHDLMDMMSTGRISYFCEVKPNAK